MTVSKATFGGRRSFRELGTLRYSGHVPEAVVQKMLDDLNNDLKEFGHYASVSVILRDYGDRAEAVLVQLNEALWRDLSDRLWLVGREYTASCVLEHESRRVVMTIELKPE